MIITRDFLRDKQTDHSHRLVAKKQDDDIFGSIYVPFKSFPEGAIGAKVTLEFTFEEGENAQQV